VTSWKDEHGEELLFVSNKVLILSLASINTCKCHKIFRYCDCMFEIGLIKLPELEFQHDCKYPDLIPNSL
jgi:hypothetical protein